MYKTIYVTLIILSTITNSKAQENISPEVGGILKQAHSFADQKEFENALKTLDKALLIYTEKNFNRYSLLNYKFNLLSELSRNQEAVLVAVEKANIVTSPKQALNVARTYLKINDCANALEWLSTSVDRGLQSYVAFDEEIFSPLKEDQRFIMLVDAVKKKIGIGLPAKPFICKTLAGNEISLNQYKEKVVLIDFWATWCSPCIAEMPNLQKLYSDYKDRGFEIVGIANDKDLEKLNKYLQKNAIQWTIVTIENGYYLNMAKLYEVTNIPASFLIDKKGVLRHVNLTGDKLRNAIDELINETM